MEFQTTVKLFIADEPTEWISSAIVCLYDRDRVTRDDHLGMNITNAYGEAVIRFTAEDYMDFDDRVGGSLPELYVKIFDSNGDCVLSTRSEAMRNAVPSLIRIPIEREVAERHGLI
ncbi:hypothetical protein BH23GEM6_BH23GEM6_01750 [soil metagenome]